MNFKNFEKHIRRIIDTEKREEELSKCIEKNLSRSTYCIVDSSNEVVMSVIELLADYYDCYYEIQGVTENDISWWLYNENKFIYINNEKIDLKNLKDFWKYLEENRQRKMEQNK